MIPDMRGLMKQMREMQSRIEELQAQFQQQEFVGSSGGGVVTATLTGGHEVRRIKIDPKVVDASDVEMLEDLVAAAVNDARAKLEERRKDEMGKLTGGMNIPGLM
jgi:DNA-binding YbaB/EbfC family protein